MAIEVFADIWCPFAYVGLLMAREQRDASASPSTPIIIRSWPLELVNGKPQNAAATKHHADDLRAQVAPELFTRVEVDNFPTSSLEALALVERTYRVNSQTGELVSFALREALFEKGQDISDQKVLREIRDKYSIPQVEDVDRAQVMADWEEGKARGVVGSPHFFHGADSMFCPSLSISRDADSHLHVATDRQRLATFLATCL